jgi:hypothetical protein
MTEFASITELLASFIVPAVTAVLVTTATYIVCGWVDELHVFVKEVLS